MSKHTPGPWMAPIGFDGNARGFVVYGPPDQFAGLRVALVPEVGMTGCGDPLPDADGSYANARLIATAPDLLEALIVARDAMLFGIESEIDNAIDVVRKAIAKAKGGEEDD